MPIQIIIVEVQQLLLIQDIWYATYYNEILSFDITLEGLVYNSIINLFETHTVTTEEAQSIVYGYRDQHIPIPYTHPMYDMFRNKYGNSPAWVSDIPLTIRSLSGIYI